MIQSYLSRHSPRVFWSPPDAERDRPVLGALVGENAALIVDTGASPNHARQFLAGLREVSGVPPRFAALTHWHWDHVFGTAAMGLPTIAHVETRRRMLEMAHLDWRDHALDGRVASGHELAFIADHLKIEMTNGERAALTIAIPEITFTGRAAVDLGGLTAQIIHVGGDHSPDCSVIYSPEERVAFLGDCFGGGFIGTENFYTLPRLLPLLAMLESLPVDTYFRGHEPGPIPRDSFLREVEQMRRISELVSKTHDRKKILLSLPGLLSEPVNEDHLYTVNALLRGLKGDC